MLDLLPEPEEGLARMLAAHALRKKAERDLLVIERVRRRALEIAQEGR